jgi:plasmid stability protein
MLVATHLKLLSLFRLFAYLCICDIVSTYDKEQIMSIKNEITRMTVELPKELHRKAKALAALHGKSVRELIISGLNQQIEEISQDQPKSHKGRKPNAETRKVLDEIIKGEGRIQCDSLDEFFKRVKS